MAFGDGSHFPCLIDIMPSLVNAFIRITEEYRDVLDYLSIVSHCDSSDNTDGNGNSVLLRGLSRAKNLVLISEPDEVNLHFAPIIF